MLCGGDKSKWDKVLTPESNSSKKNQEEEIIEIQTKSIKEETIHSLGFGGDFSKGQLFSLFSDSG